MHRSKSRRLIVLAALLLMAVWGSVGSTGSASAQINPCIGPTIPPVFIPAPTEEPTNTPFDITNPDDPTVTNTPFPITDPDDPTPTDPPVGDSNGVTTLAFQRVDDKTSLPTSTPDCDEDEPDVTPTPVRDEPDPTEVPHCDNPELTPEDDDPTPTATSTSTEVPPTETPTPTETPSPTATATFPAPGFINNTLAFAQIECDPGNDDGGDDGDGSIDVTDLPKTGTGEAGDMQAVVLLGAMAAGVLLFSAGIASARRRQ